MNVFRTRQLRSVIISKTGDADADLLVRNLKHSTANVLCYNHLLFIINILMLLNVYD